MLEVKILKVKHSGVEEAQKLTPFIQACDIYSPEQAGIPEKTARRMEADHARAIKQNWTRTRYKKFREDVFEKAEGEQQEYFARFYDDLFRARRFIWILERFAEEEVEVVRQLNMQSAYSMAEGFRALVKGGIDAFIRKYYEGIRFLEKTAELRDQNIAKNIETAEEKVRERYRIEAEPMKLTMHIGNQHQVEKYAPQVEVVELYEPTTILDKLGVERLEGKTFEELGPYILPVGMKELADKKIINLTEEQIMQMSFEEMVKTVEKATS